MMKPIHRLNVWTKRVMVPVGQLHRRVGIRYGFVCALIAFAPAIFLPVARYGDASDYVMMTMSLLYDGDLVYEAADLERILATRPEGTDFPAGMFVIRDEAGKLFVGGHSFYYSALAVPFYLVFGFRGFMVLNGLLWLLALILIQRHWTPSMGTRTSWLLALAALWFSAAYDYLLWQTPATWLLFICTGFFAAYESRRLRLAGLCLGLAAASQFTLALFGIVPVIDALRRRRALNDLKGLFAMSAVGVLPQVAYFVIIAGTLHITWLGLDTGARYLYFVDGFPGQTGFDRAIHSLAFVRFARMEHLNIAGFAAALFSPKMGLVWFYPFVFLAAIRMVRERRGGAYLVGAFVVLAGFVTAAELDTHQVGLRYLNPILPAFLFGFQAFSFRRTELVALILTVLFGISFVLFPRANSSARIWDKAVPTARLYR